MPTFIELNPGTGIVTSVPDAASTLNRPRRVVGYRFQMGGNQIADNSINGYTRNECRVINQTGNFDCHSLQLVAGNFYVPAGGLGEVLTGLSDITFEATLETVSPANPYRFTWNAQNSLLLKVGSVVASDPLGIDLAANSTLFVRTGFTTSGTTQNWPLGMGSIATGEAFFTSASASSQVFATGAMTNPSGGTGVLGGYSAYTLLGVPTTPMSNVAFITDSIGDGSGDTGDAFGNLGFLAKAFWNGGSLIPWVKLGKGGDTMQSAANPLLAYRRRFMWQFCNNFVIQLGTNDFNGGRTLAQVKADTLSLVQAVRRHAVGPIKIFACTITTRTTDGTNTTLATGFGVGGIVDQYNTWLLAGTGTNGLLLDGVVDNRPAVQNTSTNFWLGGMITDGTHPSAAGHTAMATATATAVIPNLMLS